MNTMKIMMFVCAVLLASSNLYAESLTPSQGKYIIKDGTNIDWGTEIKGCRFAVTSDKKSYYSDQPIRICLILHNAGEDSVLAQSDRFFGSRFEVRLPNDKLMPLTIAGGKEVIQFPLRGMVVRLQTNEADIKYIPAINRLFDMTKEGEYSITVYREIADFENNKIIEVPSNTIKIRILNEAKESDASKVFDKIIEKRPKPKKEDVAPKDKERELKTNKKGEIIEI